MESSKKIKKGQIEDFISDSTQTALDNKQDNLNAVNLGQIIYDELAIKSTPSPDDEIVMYDSITGEAVTAKFSDFGGDFTNIETTANKTDSIVGNETSSIKYPSVKGLVDWVTSLFVPKTRTLTIGSQTFDLSANRTFTVSGGDVYEYMNFYISGNVPYNANPDLEPFPTRGNKDVGNLAYPGDFWNRVTSTTGDYRGTAQSIFKASNLVEVIVNSSGIGQDIQIRVIAFDVVAGSVSNTRSLAVKTILGTVNANGLKITNFLPSDINSTNVINPNTMISITATVKSGTAAATINDRFYITLKFKNI